MKQTLLFTLLLILAGNVFSQQSDYLVLKKRNNRTLKTYYEGSFISAETYSGFHINGFILAIRNDSLIIRQENLELVPADFGTVLDTIVYNIGVDYRQIKKFNFQKKYTWNRKKGFAVVTLPVIMMIGGTGYIILELINTGYRNDSLKDRNKLFSMGIAAGVAAAGYLITQFAKNSNKVGGKYKVVYVDVDTK